MPFDVDPTWLYPIPSTVNYSILLSHSSYLLPIKITTYPTSGTLPFSSLRTWTALAPRSSEVGGGGGGVFIRI